MLPLPLRERAGVRGKDSRLSRLTWYDCAGLRVSLVSVVALLGTVAPAVGGGFVPGLLSRDPLHASLSAPGALGLDSSSLMRPTGMLTDSAVVALEYNAENLLRTRTGDALTADITTRGRAESLFVPLRITKQPTTFAISRASSNASAYYQDDDTGTQLTWRSASSAWAINHPIGLTRIGIAGSHYSGLAPGQSHLPRSAFKVFTGWTPVTLDFAGRDTVLQVARTLSRGSEVCVSAGSGSTRLSTVFGQSGNSISIPAYADTTQYGIDAAKQITGKLSLAAGYSRSSGSGSSPIYRNGVSSGKLLYGPSYHQLSASLKYQRRPSSLWEAGFVSSKWNLNLRGLGLRGGDLGISLRPFNDRIDFDADCSLGLSFLHVGMQRQVSDKWRLGWRYKLARLESDLNADYAGRAFFGLINVTGSYGQSLLTTRLHDLELSARYARKAVSFEARLEQVIPFGSDGPGAATSGPGPGSGPSERGKSTGGTSLSFTSSYAF